jgi:hypothetical protein
VIENPELIELLTYTGQGVGLSEKDLPGDDKLLKLIAHTYKQEFDILMNEMKVRLFVCSLWQIF